MPLNKEAKKNVVKELKEELDTSCSVVLTDYKGLNVQKISQLRKNLRDKEIKYKVYKNTLIKRASKEVGLEAFSSDLVGCTAIAFSKDEPILTVKILNDFAKENTEKFKLKRALIEGQMFFDDEINRIAELPSKEELLAKLVGHMKAPINAFVFTLKAPLSGLVNVLDQIREKKEKDVS